MAAASGRMYPFESGSRLRWFFVGQWGHLLEAIERAGVAGADPRLGRRTESLRFWNGVRSVFMVLLSLGVIGTAIAWFVELLPGAREAEEATNWVAASIRSITGVLTAIYFLLTRLLGQIETDIWALLVLERVGHKGNEQKRAFIDAGI
jgi:hypothetical protein